MNHLRSYMPLKYVYQWSIKEGRVKCQLYVKILEENLLLIRKSTISFFIFPIKIEKPLYLNLNRDRVALKNKLVNENLLTQIQFLQSVTYDVRFLPTLHRSPYLFLMKIKSLYRALPCLIHRAPFSYVSPICL